MFWKLGEQGKLDATEVFPGKVSLRSGPPAAAADCVGSAKVQFKQCTFCTFAGFANWGNCGAAAGKVQWVGLVYCSSFVIVTMMVAIVEHHAFL